MKTKFYLVISIFILFNACKKDSEITSPTGVTYQQSLNMWQTYKQGVSNNYSYTVISGSWVGFSTETKLTVQNGIVTRRDYTFLTRVNGSATVSVTKTWTETTANLNTHVGEGAATITLDDIYTQAKNDWLTADKSKNTIYFETNNKGLISSCGYVPNNCQNDCFNGITIKDIIGI